MSYDIELNDPITGKTLESNFVHEEGGTYVVGGTPLCELNITYNYYPRYAECGFGINDLHGKTAGEFIETLKSAVEKLGTERDTDDYWEATPGNAGRAVAVLLRFAEAHPEGVWSIS